MNGFLNLIKPAGYTSFDIVNEVKKSITAETGQKCADKIGHLGTLDPLAGGVLPIAIGRSTRLFNYFINKKKTYFVNITFGIATDTIDSSGKIISTNSIIPDAEQFKKTLSLFHGVIVQRPPMFSAISVNGKRAYKLARQGIETELPKRKVTIYDISYQGAVSSDTYAFCVTCSGGTYIRSLVLDIAKKLNTVAFMSLLIRTESGIFNIKDAISLEELREGAIENKLIDLETALSDLKQITIDSETEYKIDCGQTVILDRKVTGQFLIKSDSGTVIGIAENENDGKIKIITRLK